MVQIASSLHPSRNVTHMFRSWLRCLDKKMRAFILFGVAALCWALWLYRNDMVFNKRNMSSPMQVMYSCIHWLRTWSTLLRLEDRDIVTAASLRLEQVI